MNHSFNIELAKIVGIEKAIIIENILFRRGKDKANNSNFYDGRHWVYNSSRAFAEIFPYMPQSSIKRYLKELTEDGYLLCGNYNKSTYDRTTWYSPSDSILSIVGILTIHCDKMDNGLGQNEPTIPIIITNIISDIITPTPFSEDYTILEYVESRNSIVELKQNGKTVKGLPKTKKVNDKITKARAKVRKEYNKEEIVTATNNYLDRIEKTIPSPKRDGTHRYTLYEFLTRDNGLNKFINV